MIDDESEQRDSAIKLIAIHLAEIQNWADVDDLWQTVQLGLVNEKQAQQLMLQSCPVIVGTTDWIERNRLNHIF